jgi:hypothetical protein
MHSLNKNNNIFSGQKLFHTDDIEVGLGNVRIAIKIPVDEKVEKVENVESDETTTTMKNPAEAEVEVATRKKIERGKVRKVETMKKNTRTKGKTILSFVLTKFSYDISLQIFKGESNQN